jgi:soluble lytic murein transglycosylase-like protein
VRLRVAILVVAATFVSASAARAEYIVLRSGQRLNVTGYQLLGNTYPLQLSGGVAEIPASEVAGIEPEEVFTYPAPVANSRVPPYGDFIRSASRRYGVDEDLIVSVIAIESNFDSKAISRRNARGLMQLLPETAHRMGVQNIFDPKQNIEAGTRYLHDLLLRYNNDLVLALAAYNAGPVRVRQYGRVPPYAETIKYVRRIRVEYAKRKSMRRSPVMSRGGSL